MKIKGTYNITATFTRMFQQVTIPIITGENIITNKGLLFFMERIIGSTNDTIYEICLGETPDTSTFQATETRMRYEINGTGDEISPAVGIEESSQQIVLQSTILTDDIEGKNEIGVRSEGNIETGEDSILISHDFFEPLNDIGATATFILKYTYTFTNETTDIKWVVTNDTNIYSTTYDGTISNISNIESTEYIKYDTYEELLESTYGYYLDNTTLYIHTPNNPVQEELLIST